MRDLHNVEKFDLQKARAWAASEVEIRLPKAWLVIGGVAIVALLILAFD